MMVEYSQHIEERLQLRGIEHELPKHVFEKAEERYFDAETGHYVAVMRCQLYNRMREVMVAYVIKQENTILLTIHPLKEGQKNNRISTGRWRKIS